MRSRLFTVLVLAACCLTGCATTRLRLAHPGFPPEFYTALAEARRIDRIRQPIAVVGVLGQVADQPHRNVHGEEWSVQIRVLRVIAGPLSPDSASEDPSLWFAVRSPKEIPLAPGVEYYAVAAHTRHGNMLVAAIPVSR